MDAILKRLALLLTVVMWCVPASAIGFAAPSASAGADSGTAFSATTVTMLSVTITNQPAAGDLVVFTGSTGGAASETITSVVDNAGTPNTFTIPTGTGLTGGCSGDSTGGGSECVAYMIEPNGSGGKKFTVTYGTTSTFSTIHIDRYPVTGGAASFDSAIAATSGAGTASAITSPTIILSSTSELIVGGGCTSSGIVAATGSWTLTPEGLGGGGIDDGAEYQLSVSSNTAVGFSLSGTSTWSSTGMAFKFTASSTCTPTLTDLHESPCG